MKMMSLFDGSGGFPLAASLCGIEPVYASEVEPYPIAVTRSRFPDMIHLGDVSKVFGWGLEPVDVITFGSPCQDMSIAGKRAGIKHEENGDEETTRSGLFMEAARIIQEMRDATNGLYPAFAVWENVPGAFSSNKGEDFRLVLQTLIKIVEPEAVVPGVPKGGWAYADCWMGPEWSIAYRTFDAQYWGVPQRRRRIYLVLDLRGRRAGKVLFERESLRGYFETGRTPWKATATYAPGGAGVCNNSVPYTMKIRSGCEGGGKGPLIQEGKSATLATNNDQYLFVPTYCIQGNTIDRNSKQNGSGICEGVAFTLNAVDRHGVISAGFKAGQSMAGGIGYQEEVSATLSAKSSGTEPTVVCKCYDARGNGDGKIASTITGDHENRITDYTTVVCMAHGQGNAEICENKCTCLNCNHEQPIVCGVDCRNINEYQELYPTLQEKPNGGQSLNFSGAVRICYIVRRLIPTECARLQGFPDRWGDIDPLDISDQQEVDRWRYIYKDYCTINGLKVSASILGKPERLKKWHDNLHTDSGEYKMWGNGIALPNALYVMQWIAEVMA